MRITEELVRRKAEHHDGLLADLEELSLHQLQIERMEGLGALRRLRILYLQNNVIGAIEALGHARELRYLNLALNNLTAVGGLGACEFLAKLDLTVNFIGVGALEGAVGHLAPLAHLRELFLMGNPAAEQWGGYRPFVVAALPQLAALDGREVTRTERLLAAQRLPALRAELRALAAAGAGGAAAHDAGGGCVRGGSGGGDVGECSADDGGDLGGEGGDDNGDDDGDSGDGGDRAATWTPAARLREYRRVGAQKAAEEARKWGMQQPAEGEDADAAQAAALRAARAKEAAAGGRVRQVNEGRWEFSLQEGEQRAAPTAGGGGLAPAEGGARWERLYTLRLGLPRHLHSSLVDVDVHPAFVSVVARGKVGDSARGGVG